MKAIYSSNLDDYEIKNIMSINFTSGTLTIIYKDWKTGEVHTSQYTAESMPKSAQINIH